MAKIFLGNDIKTSNWKTFWTFLKEPKNADFSKKSLKNWQILHIKLELCDCKQRENTKALIERQATVSFLVYITKKSFISISHF